MGIRQNFLLAVALAAACSSARAATLADLGLSLEQIRSLNAQMTAPIAAPGIAFGSPTGFGAGWGQAFAGIGGQTVPTGPDGVDGSALLGFGMGDPRRVFGVEASMNIISLQDNFADDGNWNFKVHRALRHRAAVAIGVEDASAWGAAQDRDSSSYVVYTQAVDLSPATPKLPLTVTYNVGVGNHRFADPDTGGAGAFGSASLAWHRQGSFIVDWNGRDLGFAVSIVPFYRMPLVLTAGFTNLTERYGDTESAAGIGYLYQF